MTELEHECQKLLDLADRLDPRAANVAILTVRLVEVELKTRGPRHMAKSLETVKRICHTLESRVTH